MSRSHRSHVLSAVALLIVTTLPAFGAKKPETRQHEKGKVTLDNFVDARVNLPESFASASKPRADAMKRQSNAVKDRVASMHEAARQLRKVIPGLEVKFSSFTGAPEVVSNGAGTLTAGGTGASNESIVRSFLAQHHNLYGLGAGDLKDLVVLGDSDGGASGLRMLRMEQQINGRPVFQSETRFLIDREGRIVKTLGRMVPYARTFLSKTASTEAAMSPEGAIVRLLALAGKTANPDSFEVIENENGRLTISENDAYAAGAISARQVYFPLSPGVLVPAWSLVVFSEEDQDWYGIVDEQTGAVLWRKNIRNYASTHDARFRVFVQADGVTPADNPAPHSPTTVTPGSGTQFPGLAPTIVSMSTAQNLTASPNGWIDDCPGGVCTANETQTLGNNAIVCLDRTVGPGLTNVCDTDADSVLDGNGRPTGNTDANGRDRDFLGTAPRDFETNFLPPPQAGDPEAGQTATGTGAALDIFRRGAVTQLFYITNWYHDQLFLLGFDEGSANFQQTNFSGFGVGGDRVLGDAQDGSGTNNANFATPPDGTSGRMQMFRFTGPTVDRDGDLDAEIVIHELTHGTSNRLVGNAAGLNWDSARGLGEGWSDFYAISLLNATNADDPDAPYASGGYSTYKLVGLLDNYLYGIRRFPFSTDNAINPMTWADVDDVTNNLGGGIATSPINFNGAGGMEVHNSGEIWTLSLWEVRSRIIADPAGANGDVPTGNLTTLQLVTDAMKMTPLDPTFVEARDAILDADCATNGCANEDSIWDGFADRGLGYGAQTPYNVGFGYTSSHLSVHESFSVPFLDVADPTTDITIDDSAANNNGAIDPGEPILLTVRLTNPWRAASKSVASATATLTTGTAGVTIYDNTAAWGAIAPQAGTVAGDTFLITVDPAQVCGSSIDFTLTTTSSLGTTATTFQLRVGLANGTDAPVTYSATPNLAIPDNSSRGAFTQMNVTDDLVISDIDFRIDSATHTWTGDLSFMLRSPGDVGVDLISVIGGMVDGGPGDNLLNMVIDDDVAFIAANDMVQAGAAGAPFSKSWLPVFNSPWTTLAFGVNPDAVGNLSRYDGTSTLGTWTVHASDQASGDVGTLQTWSIIVTPVNFDCVVFAPAALAGATKTATGPFVAGGAMSYTVTITNSGTDAQDDNVGDEFTDVLPAGLTLVSATATSGTAVATIGTNTVTWNGSLAPLGGSVTITINATIDAGTEGSMISNQGTVSYDSDNDGANDTAALTDDPSLGGATDPTAFIVAGGATLSGTKTFSGTPAPGSTITYSIVLTNGGPVTQADNAGNELTDVLPASLTLVSANATSGTAVATIGTNTVTWNGSIAPAGTVTITITATVNVVPVGTLVSNQGTIAFDSNNDGTNDGNAVTDDPTVVGAADPTNFTSAAAAAQIPTLGGWMLILFAMTLAFVGVIKLRS